MITLLPLIGFAHADVQHLTTRQESDIDVGREALTLAKEIYPHIDIEQMSTQIDNLAEQVRILCKGSENPDTRIRCLNTVIHRQEQIKANQDNSFKRNPDDFFLGKVLETKQGNCFSLPLLYVAIGQRLGWPLYLVHVPDHAFVRYVDPNLTQQNIEATSGGGSVSDHQYVRDFKISQKGRESGAYLKTLTYKELLGDVVALSAITFGQKGYLDRAISYLEVATQLNPKSVGAWSNLANAYQMKAKKIQIKLQNLGFVHPKNVPLITTTRNAER